MFCHCLQFIHGVADIRDIRNQRENIIFNFKHANCKWPRLHALTSTWRLSILINVPSFWQVLCRFKRVFICCILLVDTRPVEISSSTPLSYKHTKQGLLLQLAAPSNYIPERWHIDCHHFPRRPLKRQAIVSFYQALRDSFRRRRNLESHMSEAGIFMQVESHTLAIDWFRESLPSKTLVTSRSRNW